MAAEFQCPLSPNPAKPTCIIDRRCFWAAEFERQAQRSGAQTKKQAEMDVMNRPGPWYRRVAWQQVVASYKNMPCAQTDFKNREIDRIDREKRSSGKLV